MADTIGSTDLASVYAFLARCEALIGNRASSFEAAAQAYADSLYEAYASSVVLARVFATIPFGALPPREAKFAESLAATVGVRLAEETPVLTLFGTRGDRTEWNDRAHSTGHVAIPLVSEQFVASTPMISRLLEDLGLQVARNDQGATSIVERVLPGGLAGLFYVADAAAALDTRSRPIIANQAFVATHQVKTVFGMGGTFPGGHVATLIVFTRELMARSVAHRFLPVTSQLKAVTLSAILKGKFFR